MRISEISITRLFGLFNHTIPMNLSEHLTIIHGPNGFGKTTLLHLIDSLIAGRYSDLRKVPFRDFQISFDSGEKLHIVRTTAPPSPPGVSGPRVVSQPGLQIALFTGDKIDQKTTIPGLPPEIMDMPAHYVERSIPYYRKLSLHQWLDDRSGLLLGLEEVVRDNPEYFPIGQKIVSSIQEPDWLRKFRASVRAKFIESQRLLRLSKSSARADDEATRLSVVAHSRDLAKQIQTTLAEYATLSQSLDRSFPKRLVEQSRNRSKKPTSTEVLKTRLQRLEDRRASLTSAGLLDKEPESFDLGSYLNDADLTEGTESVLPVYAQDAEQKLAVFDAIAPKIALLTNIINAHFQFKVLSINKDRGFEFTTKYPGPSPRPRSIVLSQLSSGEQHMLVLLYELLFVVHPNSLIMIDEPEISLHVAWQLQFLSDLRKITELTGIDILIATHAPALVNDRRDLLVELEAPKEVQ